MTTRDQSKCACYILVCGQCVHCKKQVKDYSKLPGVRHSLDKEAAETNEKK